MSYSIFKKKSDEKEIPKNSSGKGQLFEKKEIITPELATPFFGKVKVEEIKINNIEPLSEIISFKVQLSKLNELDILIENHFKGRNRSDILRMVIYDWLVSMNIIISKIKDKTISDEKDINYWKKLQSETNLWGLMSDEAKIHLGIAETIKNA